MRKIIVALFLLIASPSVVKADGWSWRYTGITQTSQVAREVTMRSAFATLPNDHFTSTQYPYAQVLNWIYFYNGSNFVEAGIGWDWAGYCRNMGRKKGPIIPSYCIWWASQDHLSMSIIDKVPLGAFVETRIAKNADASALVSWVWVDANMQTQRREKLVSTGTWTTELGYHPCQMEVAINSVFNNAGGLALDAKPRNIHLNVSSLSVFPNDTGRIYSTEPSYFQAAGNQASFVVDVE